jgi:hypothetical protein
MPPRGGAQRRGVLATRSPHRPNPIGITCVPLISVDRLEIVVGNTDLVDGTPILDIKPYIPSVDAFPDSSQGWIEEVEQALLSPPSYTVRYSPLATQQAEWLRDEWGIDFSQRTLELLSRDPTVHRTRRIRRNASGRLVMGCGAWRIYFSVLDKFVDVDLITPGYPNRLLLRGPDNLIPDQEAQIAFQTRWPDSSLSSL